MAFDLHWNIPKSSNWVEFIPHESLSLLLIFISCKKSRSVAPENNVKIDVISGNNQSDTAGRVLNNAIIKRNQKPA